MRKALSFDDVLIVPKRSTVGSRNQIDLSQKFLGFGFKLPIISANMSTVTEFEMASAMHYVGGLGIIHRMCTPEYQCEIVKRLRKASSNMPIAAAIEGSESGLDRATMLSAAGCDILCVDVAHADSDNVISFLWKFLQIFKYCPLIIGNISTIQAAKGIQSSLYKCWHDHIAFKVGVGSGSQCTTRIVTGCGMPTLASLFDIGETTDTPLIADGGIKNSGDIVKSLAAGAQMVMVGNLLAGTDQAPGSIIKQKGQKYKIYRGSASYGQKSEINKNGFIEGEESLVPYKGSVLKILEQLEEGIKSGFSYMGMNSMEDLLKLQHSCNIEFVEITNSGQQESMPHGAL